MVFIACGLNHKTASVALREKMVLPKATQDTWLNRLVSIPAVEEAALLATCNRTEIYCNTEDPAAIPSWFAKAHAIPLEILSPFLYTHQEEEAIRHTLRVATGLDSMMLGEPQILGQMKQAYREACILGSAKEQLRSVFDYIFSASKRIRRYSGLGKNPISVAAAAANLISSVFKDAQALRVFLIGSGETTTLLAKYLYNQGIRKFFVTSRTEENAMLLADSLNAVSIPVTEIAQYLAAVDIVISATACPLPFITPPMVQAALTKRSKAPLFFLDLAVPRDIEAEVADLPGVTLYNIDDLQELSSKGMNERRIAAKKAETLIEQELVYYQRKHRERRAKDIICHYRSHMQDLAQTEVQRAIQKLSQGLCQETVLTEFSERLIKKLIHNPSTGLRQAAGDGREELLDLAKYLFTTITKPSYEKIT